MALIGALWGLAVLGGAACGQDPTSEAIEYCVPLESGAGGVPVSRVVLNYERYDADHRPTRADTLRFLVATEQPFTLVDSRWVSAPTADATTWLESVGVAVTDAVSDPPATRAAFWDLTAVAQPLPVFGPRGAAEGYDGLLGGDVLRHYAVRMVLAPDPTCRLPWLTGGVTWPSLTFRQELPDTAGELSDDGYAVLAYTLAGGGSAELGDADFSFGATRVTVGVCVAPEPFDPDAVARMNDIPLSGVDAWGLVATGTQPLLLRRSFYERLAAQKTAEAGGPWPVGGGTGSIFLQEGETFAMTFPLRRFALVGSRSNAQSPCLELQQRRRIEWAERCRADPACAATLNDEEEAVGLGRKGAGVLEVDVDRGGSGPLPAYVVADETMLFSGLRAELGTAVPSVDLLVGAAFLRYFEVVLDYPGNRLVMRCADYKAPTPQRTCDPGADPGRYPACCPPAATLAREGRSCCDTRGGVDSTGQRHARSCHCAGATCCQYFRYEPDDQ